MDRVPSPGCEGLKESIFAAWPRTHTPAYTVTHRDAKQVWATL